MSSLPLDANGLPLPGRELDRWIAENIFYRDPMNARHRLSSDGDIQYYWGYPIGHAYAPKYSTSHAYHRVMEAMRKQGRCWKMDELGPWLRVMLGPTVEMWELDWSNLASVEVPLGDSEEKAYAHAVCACAWKAKGAS